MSTPSLLRAFALLLALSLPAQAQPLETVEVDSNKTLTGLW